MAIGERIRFFRNLRGMTQKLLGIQVGFPEKTADIRIAQYESGTRTPKEDLTHTFRRGSECFSYGTERPGHRQRNRHHAHTVCLGGFTGLEDRQVWTVRCACG